MTGASKKFLLIIFLASIPFTAWLLFNYIHRITTIPPLPPEYYKIGVVNMDYDHPIKINNVLDGDDPLIVIFTASPYYTQIMNLARQLGNTSPDIRFELSLYDSNKDQLIDSEDPIWRYLYAIIFKDQGRGYDVKTLDEIGIHAIALRHITPKGNHTVILSDGSERILFELGTPLKGLTVDTNESKVNPYNLPGS